jgi:hypothetical protein
MDLPGESPVNAPVPKDARTDLFSIDVPVTLSAIVRREPDGTFLAEIPSIPGSQVSGESVEEVRAKLARGAPSKLGRAGVVTPVRIDDRGRVFRADGTEVLDIGMTPEELLEGRAEGDRGRLTPLEDVLAEHGL